MIAAADRNRAPQELIEGLQALAREEFADVGAVLTALADLRPG